VGGGETYSGAVRGLAGRLCHGAVLPVRRGVRRREACRTDGGTVGWRRHMTRGGGRMIRVMPCTRYPWFHCQRASFELFRLFPAHCQSPLAARWSLVAGRWSCARWRQRSQRRRHVDSADDSPTQHSRSTGNDGDGALLECDGGHGGRYVGGNGDSDGDGVDE
jgi:hypothetical protein